MDTKSDPGSAVALMQRDALMTLLVARCQELIQRLALLAGPEKEAVAGLMAVSQVMTAYEHCAQSDRGIMEGFDHVLASLSPALLQRMTLLSAPAETTGGISPDETERMTREIKQLLAVLTPDYFPKHLTGGSRPIPSRR